MQAELQKWLKDIDGKIATELIIDDSDKFLAAKKEDLEENTSLIYQSVAVYWN